MTDLDHETRAAIQALAGRLRNRDPDVDDELFAAEFITALRGRGWRPTEARVMPSWKPAGTRGDHPATGEFRQIRAEWEAQPHPNRSREDAP
jgi:hypothetical protein